MTIVWLLLLIVTIFLPNNIAESRKEIIPRTNDDCNGETTLPKAGESITGSTRSTVVFLYFFIFCYTLLSQITCFYTPLLLKYRLGLGLSFVKLFYLDSTLLAFVFVIATYLFVERYSETNILLLIALSSVFPIVTIFYFALNWDNNMSVNAAYLLLLSMFVARMHSVGFPVISSVISKLTPVEGASFYQSLSFAVVHLSVILARVTAGATFDRMPLIWVCLGLTVNWLLQIIWFAIEYQKIK